MTKARFFLTLIALQCWLLIWLWQRAQKLDHVEFVADQRLLVARDLIQENYDLRQQYMSLRRASR